MFAARPLIALSCEEIRFRSTRLYAQPPYIRIEFHAMPKPVGAGVRRTHVRLGLFMGAKAVDLKLRLIAVWIGLIHRHADAVVDAFMGNDSLFL